MASTGPNLERASLNRQPIDYTLIHGAGTGDDILLAYQRTRMSEWQKSFR